MTFRIHILALCAAAFAGGAFAYGVDVKAALKHETESTCVPINSALVRMRQPDGVTRILVRSREDPNFLRGRKPWIGVVRPERRMINVMTAPDFKGEKTEFCFVGGVLRFMSVGKKDYEFKASDYAAPTNSIESLWPAATLTDQEQIANDMWRGSGRIRFLSRNPNRAALIFVHVGLIALGAALFAGSLYGRLHGTLWALISIVLLLQTQSRGGFLSFVLSAGVLLFFRWRKGIGRRLLVVLTVLVLLLAGTATVTGVAHRVTVGTVQVEDDASSQKRLTIWREVPRMMAAAPLGWGLWKSGPAYNAWFEKPGRMHMIGDLFNDHLSRFVEGGFVLGGVYVFVWCLLLIGSWRFAWRDGSPVPFTVALSYFVASSFNPMNYWTPSFVLPTAVGVWWVTGFVRRIHVSGALIQAFRLASSTGCFSLAMTALVLGGAGCVAWRAPAQDVPLRVGWQGRQVVVGEGEPELWVVDDGFVLCGDYNGFPGKEIREFYQQYPKAEPIGLVEDVGDLPEKVGRLVLVGKSAWNLVPAEREDAEVLLPETEHVIALTPPFGIDRITEKTMVERDVHVLTGDLAARLTEGGRRPDERMHVVPGTEVYVPGWLDMLVRKE